MNLSILFTSSFPSITEAVVLIDYDKKEGDEVSLKVGEVITDVINVSEVEEIEGN